MAPSFDDNKNVFPKKQTKAPVCVSLSVFYSIGSFPYRVKNDSRGCAQMRKEK